MSNALYAKNKFGFINGDIPMPEKDSPYLSYWQRANAMVKAWLNSSMELELRQSVKFKTAREIWVDQEERFGKESAPGHMSYGVRLGLFGKMEKPPGGQVEKTWLIKPMLSLTRKRGLAENCIPTAVGPITTMIHALN
ncbi:unnamed protein product [Cuscuta epithymum]|uniref:Retrotransposon Copia-like N-terminal domain-containing protein n=1 Tax=Cuscuta epithymum TaxID=186058 RepID=A0AAV0C5T7_9ASTE|nr:unnamed protein product [Cuscuta epithymum]